MTTTELCSLMNFGNSIPMLRSSYQIKMRAGTRDPFALECVYALMMIDFLSNKFDHISYANQVQEVEKYRQNQTSRLVEQLIVYDMVRILGLVKAFPDTNREIDRTFAVAVSVIPNKTLQSVLASKIHQTWPSSDFHLIHPRPEKATNPDIVQRLNLIKGKEDKRILSSIYCLFLFITCRVEYYHMMEEQSLEEVDDQIAFSIPKQIGELERALLMCPLPTDELDLYILKDQLKKFHEDCRKVNVFSLVEIVSVNCWHSVHKYISEIEANLTKW